MDTRISLLKLDVLCRVVACGTVTRAAEELGVAQPVVTGHVRSLEQRLGVTLFARRGRTLELTEAGVAVHAWARDVVDRTRAVEPLLDQLAGDARASVRVAACSNGATHLLPDVLVRFQRRQPAAAVQLLAMTTELAVRAVARGDCDFGVVSYLDGADAAPGLTVERLRDEPLVLVCAPGREPPGPLPVARLAELPFVCTPSGSARRRALDRRLAELGVPARRIAIELGHSEALKTAVLQGAGVALVARGSVARELAAGALREIALRDARLSFGFDLVTRAEHALTRLQRELVAEIRATAAAGR